MKKYVVLYEKSKGGYSAFVPIYQAVLLREVTVKKWS